MSDFGCLGPWTCSGYNLRRSDIRNPFFDFPPRVGDNSMVVSVYQHMKSRPEFNTGSGARADSPAEKPRRVM